MTSAIAASNVHSTVISMAKELDRGKVLDTGAGHGALSKKLIELGFKVDCCDIREMKRIPGASFFKVDLNNKLPFSDNTYDAAFCVEVIEHIQNPWKLISELYRVVKPGGYLILSTPNVNNWYSRLSFLFLGRFAHFYQKDPLRHSGHITPIFFFTFKWMIQGKFKIEKIKFNQSIIPLLRIKLPVNNLMFGDVVVFKLKSLK